MSALPPDLARVYEEHLHYVWRLLTRFGIPSRDREDVAHDVFVVVHRKLDDFDPERPIRPWLAGIAFRVALAYKRRKMSGEIPSELPELPNPNRAEIRHQASQLLAKLPFERRAVFVLHELEGLTAPEISEELAVPLNTVYSRLRLARRDLRQLTTPPDEVASTRQLEGA
ncbi:MAG: sigma-70 family RNA polymerase sigma factor [Deltaproteobacteria bacterium]|nr:sigma-70 family RNA polymerase sigma factor [Deltaproteobacteria bacterium]